MGLAASPVDQTDSESRLVGETHTRVGATVQFVVVPQLEALRDTAIRAFEALEGEGLGRVDFLVEKETDTLFVNEVNSLPGFTDGSMYPKLWEATGLPYPALLDRLIELAIERHRGRRALVTQYTRS